MQLNESIYNKTILDNQIRIITEKLPHVRSVSIGAWVITGSRNENHSNSGISHFIEHMMFKGTSNRTFSEIAQSLESVGGMLNAFTGKEQTCYYAHILDEHLPLALDVISDILLNSVFDENEMNKEKKVILEELSNIEETPEELIHDLFWEDVFKGHSLGYSIIGNRETINNFAKQNVHDYLGDNYTANKIVIVAAGNVDHDNLVRQVQNNFNKSNQVRDLIFTSPVGISPTKRCIENGAIQSHICIGTPAYAYNNQKKFALLLLNTLLGVGMSSRLYQNIREKYGIAYSIYSFIDFLYDTGIFGVYIGTEPHNIDTSQELINTELQKLTKKPLTKGELLRTKSQLKGNITLGLESTSSRMSRLAKMEIYMQDYYTLDSTLAEIDKITADEILEVASDLFPPKRLFTTILKPKDN